MINDILWIQDSVIEDTKLFLNGEPILHSDNRFQQLYSILCDTDKSKKIENGSKSELFKCGQKSYIIKGRFTNLDENGRRIPFMAYINNIKNLDEAKDKLIDICSKQGFDIIAGDINVSEGGGIFFIVVSLLVILIGGFLCYLIC